MKRKTKEKFEGMWDFMIVAIGQMISILASGMARVFAGLVGTGPGSGMSLVIILTSFGGMIALASGFLIPAVRNVERILPDHDQFKKQLVDPSNQRRDCLKQNCNLLNELYSD